MFVVFTRALRFRPSKLAIVGLGLVMLLDRGLALNPALAADEPQTLLTNVRVFNGVDTSLEGADVLVQGNLVLDVGTDLDVTEGARIIDGGGRVLSPGFVDAHTHMSLIAPFDQLENEYTGVYVGAAAGQMAEEMLMRGFTTVRDAGGVGDIGLRYLRADGRSVDTPLHDRVIGIELEQLKRVPRSIAVAGGPGKTNAIHAALVGGWVNCLITDTYTAKRLLEMSAGANKTRGLEEEIVEHAIGAGTA